MKKKLWILGSLFVTVLALGYFLNIIGFLGSSNKIISSPTPISTPVSSPSITSSSTSTPTPVPSSIPDSFLISNFPFESQAPFANWDQLHDEACEEATLALTHYYLQNKPIDAATMDNQILKMVSWEETFFGSHKDLTIAELAQMAKNFYSLENVTQKNNISLDDIKKEIAQNHPVIVPTAGRMLGNPNFRSPGPVYHMVVVIGYRGNTIIVQDVGTRNGNHYEYNGQILFNAIHDWNGTPDNIEGGKKSMLTFTKN